MRDIGPPCFFRVISTYRVLSHSMIHSPGDPGFQGLGLLPGVTLEIGPGQYILHQAMVTLGKSPNKSTTSYICMLRAKALNPHGGVK